MGSVAQKKHDPTKNYHRQRSWQGLGKAFPAKCKMQARTYWAVKVCVQMHDKCVWAHTESRIFIRSSNPR
jgi:hypothetical protein